MHPKSLKPVMPYDSTIPSYTWYLPAIPKEVFHVLTLNLQLHICFVPIQAHGTVGVDSIFREKRALPKAKLILEKIKGNRLVAECPVLNGLFKISI